MKHMDWGEEESRDGIWLNKRETYFWVTGR